MGKYKKVEFVEDFYSTIKKVHEKELFHAGYHMTYEKVECKFIIIPTTITMLIKNILIYFSGDEHVLWDPTKCGQEVYQHLPHLPASTSSDFQTSA